MPSARFSQFKHLECMALIALASVSLLSKETCAADLTNGSAILDRLRQYHNELQDMTAKMKIEHVNSAALSRISPDFAEFVHYGFRSFDYCYKNPDKVRMSGSASMFHFLEGISIRNGNRKDFYIPVLHIHKTSDVTGAPNKKETALDFGVFAGDVWSMYDISVVGSAVVDGSPAYDIKLQAKNQPDSGKMIVRVDAATLKILERDRYYGYDKPDKVQQRQVFSSFVQVTPHVWIPTLVKLYNEFGQLGGDITYTNIAVNKGVPDKTFKR